MKRMSAEPLSRASGALAFLAGLAQRGAGPERMQREAGAIVAEWLADAMVEGSWQQAAEAVGLLQDKLSAGIDETREAVENLLREDVAGMRAGERLLASLEAARGAVSEAVPG